MSRFLSMGTLGSLSLICSATVLAEDAATVAPTQTLSTISTTAQSGQVQDNDISAVAKTIITQEEMLRFGDQSVNDTLRRAAGFQMPSGPGPRGPAGAGGMRFRGGGAPVFLINGEPVQGGPRSGMSIIDTLTPEMIERIELIKQPSVAQASVSASATINIILKKPLEHKLLGGHLRLGYGLSESEQREEERKNVVLQAEGREGGWLYSFSANQSWDDSTAMTQTSSQNQTSQQKVISERQSLMLSPRLEYEFDDENKASVDMFYRQSQRDSVREGQLQNDENESLRFNARYENQQKERSDKIRFGFETQDEQELTQGRRFSDVQEKSDEYSLAYDGVRKLNDHQQIKFGVDSRYSELSSNVADTLDEQRYAAYIEGSWRFSDRQTVTLGARQEWLDRSGLVEYQDQHLSPVLAHRFDFNPQWSLQTNLSQSFRSPNSNRLLPNLSISTDADAGSLNNPDRGGNPSLKAEQITAMETTLGYNTPAGGFNLTAYQRDVDDYIERVIREENGRFVERPTNQNKANTYGVELSGRYALKQTENGHSWMLNGQISTVRAKIEQANGTERLASDVAPYSASTGFSYNYQPWQLATSVNLAYTPAYSRELDQQPYIRSTNERVNIDLSVTKRFKDGWALSANARNILSTDYKERLNHVDDGSFYQARTNEAIPSFLVSLEKKF